MREFRIAVVLQGRISYSHAFASVRTVRLLNSSLLRNVPCMLIRNIAAKSNVGAVQMSNRPGHTECLPERSENCGKVHFIMYQLHAIEVAAPRRHSAVWRGGECAEQQCTCNPDALSRAGAESRALCRLAAMLSAFHSASSKRTHLNAEHVIEEAVQYDVQRLSAQRQKICPHATVRKLY